MTRLLIRLGLRRAPAPAPARVVPGLALALARGDADTIAMYSAALALMTVVAARPVATEGGHVRADD